MIDAHEAISEICREDTEELLSPLEEWEIEVVQRGLHQNLGNVGGREPSSPTPASE